MAKEKTKLDLDCRAPAAPAIQLVLQNRLEEMCALRDLALDWSDPEGVHDMRVASRRLRSALSDFKPYLRPGTLPRGRLKMIATALGTVRDEDVSLLALESLKSAAAEKIAEGIEAIAEERRLRRAQERLALEQKIDKAAMMDFQNDFLARLKTAVPNSEDAPLPGKPHPKPTFRRVGVEVITSRLQDLSAGSACIYDPARTKDLHRLRILAKRLRYAVELFSPCWIDEFRTLGKEVAKLQTSLGGLHDCDIWIAELGARIRTRNRNSDQSTYDPDAEAAVWLLRHFADERTKHYVDALIRWQEWQATGFLTGLQRVVRQN